VELNRSIGLLVAFVAVTLKGTEAPGATAALVTLTSNGADSSR